MPIALTIKVDTRAVMRGLTDLQRRQVPFAMSLATNAIARHIVDAEIAALGTTFKAPRAFTKSAFTQAPSFGGRYASKRDPVAVIVARPIQEAYLAPSEFGEVQSLGQGKRIRTPVNVKLDASGDIPRGTIARYLAEPDCFMGVIRGVNGIWQRPSPPRPKGSPRRKIKSNTSGRLKLLIAFTRPVKVKTHLGYFERAHAIATQHFEAEFDAALRKAMATAR